MEYANGGQLAFGIGMPSKIAQILDDEQEGLILITGKPGSGYTGLLASMTNYINSTQSKEIILIEDRPGIIHVSDRSTIHSMNSQGSISDTMLKALRMAPDVIVMEIFDAETLFYALRASETGHLVIAFMADYVFETDSIWDQGLTTLIKHNSLLLRNYIYYPLAELVNRKETVQTLDQAVMELAEKGIVDLEEAQNIFP